MLGFVPLIMRLILRRVKSGTSYELSHFLLREIDEKISLSYQKEQDQLAPDLNTPSDEIYLFLDRTKVIVLVRPLRYRA